MRILIILILLVFEFGGSPGTHQACREQLTKDLKQLWKGRLIEVEPSDCTSLPTGKELFAGRLMLEGKPVGYFISNRVNACMEGGCTNPANKSGGRYDYFTYLAIYDAAGKIIRIKILDYESEYGYEIAGRIWLKQFTGYYGDEIHYRNQIDALAGATVSATALVDEINFNARIINLLRK